MRPSIYGVFRVYGVLRGLTKMNYLDMAKQALTNNRATVVETPKPQHPTAPTINKCNAEAIAGGKSFRPTPTAVVPNKGSGECCCGSTATHDVAIHGGRSTRRDCAKCGRFQSFPVWYGTTFNHNQ
jgi:hypothetical protein